MLKKLWNWMRGQQPPSAAAVAGAANCSAKCATCKFFDRAFPQNRQLGYCKGIQIQHLDGGGIAIMRRIYKYTPGDEAIRLMDDFGCAYHSPNDRSYAACGQQSKKI